MPEHKIVKQGISHVPEGRRMFSNLTVLENLKMGAYTRKDKQEINNSLETVSYTHLDVYKRQVCVSGLIHHKIHPGIFMQAQGIEYTL